MTTATATIIIMPGIIIRIKQENTSQTWVDRPLYELGFSLDLGSDTELVVAAFARNNSRTHGFRFRSHFRGDLLVFAR